MKVGAMNTATPIMTNTRNGVTQTTYEVSQPLPYTRLTGETYQTSYIIVSHARYSGVDETAVFPGTMDGEATSYIDMYMSAPASNDETALSALGLTPTAPAVPTPQEV